MSKIKKAILSNPEEIELIVPQAEEVSSVIPVTVTDDKEILKDAKNKKKIAQEIIPEIPAPVVEMHKEKFKQLHMEDTYWLENDIYQTIVDMTGGKKGAKTLLINQALKDYLGKNNMEIKPLRAKGKKK